MKIPGWRQREGSSPSTRTKLSTYPYLPFTALIWIGALFNRTLLKGGETFFRPKVFSANSDLKALFSNFVLSVFESPCNNINSCSPQNFRYKENRSSVITLRQYVKIREFLQGSDMQKCIRFY